MFLIVVVIHLDLVKKRLLLDDRTSKTFLCLVVGHLTAQREHREGNIDVAVSGGADDGASTTGAVGTTAASRTEFDTNGRELDGGVEAVAVDGVLGEVGGDGSATVVCAGLAASRKRPTNVRRVRGRSPSREGTSQS